MSKKDLSKLTTEELLLYKDELMEIYDRLLYECENWSRTKSKLDEELKLRRDEIDLELDILKKNTRGSSIDFTDLKKLFDKEEEQARYH